MMGEAEPTRGQEHRALLRGVEMSWLPPVRSCRLRWMLRAGYEWTALANAWLEAHRMYDAVGVQYTALGVLRMSMTFTS